MGGNDPSYSRSCVLDRAVDPGRRCPGDCVITSGAGDHRENEVIPNFLDSEATSDSTCRRCARGDDGDPDAKVLVHVSKFRPSRASIT